MYYKYIYILYILYIFIFIFIWNRQHMMVQPPQETQPRKIWQWERMLCYYCEGSQDIHLCSFSKLFWSKDFRSHFVFLFYRKLYQLFACLIKFSHIQRKPIEDCPYFLVTYISIRRFHLSHKKCDNRSMASLPAHQHQKTFQFGSMHPSVNAFPDLEVKCLKV